MQNLKLILLFGFLFSTLNAQDNFFAFYTKIDSGKDFEKYSRTGPYADIIVQMKIGKLVFHRSSSYLPYWETTNGKWYLDEIIPRDGDGSEQMPDRVNALSHVRIISQKEDEIIIHWRYEPTFSVEPNPYKHVGIKETDFVDEYFYIKTDGKVKRTIRKGTDKIDAWKNLSSLKTQTFNLSDSGVENINLTESDVEIKEVKIEGSPVIQNNKIKPVSYWSFDEGKGDYTKEQISGKICIIHGHKSLWKKGISGTALQFDGYHSIVTLPAYNSPIISDELTLEAWIAIGAYPWNWTPIIKQGDDEGFFLGINSYGQPGFKIHVDEEWHELVDKNKLKAFNWYHIAGTYSSSTGEMKLYVNGELLNSKQITKDEIHQVKIDVQIGKGMKREATDVVRFKSDVAAEYGFDGLIDEVKIYQTALSVEDILTCYESMKPNINLTSISDMQPRKLPETNYTPKFGAKYTKLNYYETWENLWRVGEHSDIIVNFEEQPSQIAFWRVASYIPELVTENGIWFGHEFNEIWATETIQCMEPLADVKTNYSHVRLIENTDARVVVHWRYALNDVLNGIGNYDSETGWGEFADWYYTIYPDGVAAVKMVLWSNLGAFRGREKGHREWQESIAIIPPGKKPDDIYETKNCISVSDLQGNVVNYDWGPDFDVTNKKIQVINLKSDYEPFLIGDFLRGNCYYGELTEYSVFPCWNHWPAAVTTNDGRNMLDDTRIGHSSTTQITMETAEDHSNKEAPFVIQYKLEGLTKKSAGELIPLASSWLKPAKVKNFSGAKRIEYDKGQRAYIINPSEENINFALEGSKGSPIVNPSFVIKDCSKNIKVLVDGENIITRQGMVRDTDGKLQLVVFIEYESKTPMNIEFLTNSF